MNMKSALVLTGYGLGEYTYYRHQWEHKPDLVGKTLLEVAQQVQNNDRINMTVKIE